MQTVPVTHFKITRTRTNTPET